MTRYEYILAREGMSGMIELPNGKYVLASDYDALERKVAELNEERRNRNVLFAALCEHDVLDPMIACLNPVELVRVTLERNNSSADALQRDLAAAREALESLVHSAIHLIHSSDAITAVCSICGLRGNPLVHSPNCGIGLAQQALAAHREEKRCSTARSRL